MNAIKISGRVKSSEIDSVFHGKKHFSSISIQTSENDGASSFFVDFTKGDPDISIESLIQGSSVYIEGRLNQFLDEEKKRQRISIIASLLIKETTQESSSQQELDIF